MKTNEKFEEWVGTPINEEDSVSDELSRMKPLASAQIAFNCAYQTRQPEIDALIRERDVWIGKWHTTAEENGKLKSDVSTYRNLAECWRDRFNHQSRERASLMAEVAELKKELSVMDIAQECLDADKEEE